CGATHSCLRRIDLLSSAGGQQDPPRLGIGPSPRRSPTTVISRRPASPPCSDAAPPQALGPCPALPWLVHRGFPGLSHLLRFRRLLARIRVPPSTRPPQGAPPVRRIAFAAALLIGWFVPLAVFAADPLVVDLWPGKVPGDIGIKGEETSRIHQSPLVGPTKLVTNVTKPTLTICRPSPEKNTGTAMIICPGGGYWDLYWELEGEEVAAWLNSQGMTGI